MSRIEYNVAFRDNRGGLNDCECGWVDTTGLKEFTGHEQHVADAVKSLEFEHDQDPGRVVDRPTFLVKREISDWMVDD